MKEISEQTLDQGTILLVGTPKIPLENKIIQKLIENFQRVKEIKEVYQHGQKKNNEFSLVLGFKLLTNSDAAKIATINAVTNALQGEKIDQLLDLFFIEDESWYETIKNIKNSFVYKK